MPARAFGKEDKGVISTIGNVPPPSFSPQILVDELNGAPFLEVVARDIVAEDALW